MDRLLFVLLAVLLLASLASAKTSRTYYDAALMSRVREKLATQDWARGQAEQAGIGVGHHIRGPLAFDQKRQFAERIARREREEGPLLAGGDFPGAHLTGQDRVHGITRVALAEKDTELACFHRFEVVQERGQMGVIQLGENLDPTQLLRREAGGRSGRGARPEQGFQFRPVCGPAPGAGVVAVNPGLGGQAPLPGVAHQGGQFDGTPGLVVGSPNVVGRRALRFHNGPCGGQGNGGGAGLQEHLRRAPALRAALTSGIRHSGVRHPQPPPATGSAYRALHVPREAPGTRSPASLSAGNPR